MNTFKRPGNTRSWTNTTGSDVAAGKLVILRSGTSGECGITVNAIANNATGIVVVSGEHELTAETGAIAAHGLVYRKASNGNVTTSSTSNTLAGVATVAKTTSGTSARILLNSRPSAADLS